MSSRQAAAAPCKASLAAAACQSRASGAPTGRLCSARPAAAADLRLQRSLQRCGAASPPAARRGAHEAGAEGSSQLRGCAGAPAGLAQGRGILAQPAAAARQRVSRCWACAPLAARVHLLAGLGGEAAGASLLLPARGRGPERCWVRAGTDTGSSSELVLCAPAGGEQGRGPRAAACGARARPRDPGLIRRSRSLCEAMWPRGSWMPQLWRPSERSTQSMPLMRGARLAEIQLRFELLQPQPGAL